MKKKRTSTSSGKSRGARPGKIFIYALALAALGGGGYLVYDKIRRRKLRNDLPEADVDFVPTSSTLPALVSAKTVSVTQSGFPLKKGSKGELVKALQQALVKTNPSIVIDGKFGAKTEAALKAAAYPQTVTQDLFAKITGTGSGTLQLVFNPPALAAELYKSAQAKDLSGVLGVLKQMKSVAEYSSVNDYYKRESFISKTIVTDLLDYAFKFDEPAKGQIKNEFLRMGLKVNSSGSWSLQGLRLYRDLITIRETIVTDSQDNRIPVRRNTILGDELEVANGMTWFRSIDNSVLKVPAQDVKNT